MLFHGRSFSVLERKDLELDLGQLDFESGKLFELSRIKYIDGSKEYNIKLTTPQGFCYDYLCGNVHSLIGSEEMFENVYEGLSKMNRQVVLDRTIFTIY